MKSLHHALQRSTLNLLVIMLGLFFILGSGDIVITINGDNPVTVVQGSTYIDAGATAKDDDGDLDVTTTGLPIDTSIVGTYEVTYTATGDDGEKKAIRKVNVITSTSTLSKATLAYSDSPVLNKEFTIMIEEAESSNSEFTWSVISEPDGSQLLLTPSSDGKSVTLTPSIAGKYKVKVQTVDGTELTTNFGILKKLSYDESKKKGIKGIIENQSWIYSNLSANELTTMLINKYPKLVIVGFREGQGILIEYDIQDKLIPEVIENLKLESGIIDVLQRSLYPSAGSVINAVSSPPDENWQLDFIDINEVREVAGNLSNVDIGIVDGGFATTEGSENDAKRVVHKDLKRQFKIKPQGILIPYKANLKYEEYWKELVKKDSIDDTDYCKNKWRKEVFDNASLLELVEGDFSHGIAVSGTIGGLNGYGINESLKLDVQSYLNEEPFNKLSENGVKIINFSAGSSQQEFKCKSGLLTWDSASYEITENGKKEFRKSANLRRAYLKTKGKNTLLIVAAGNDGVDAKKENGAFKYLNNGDFEDLSNLIVVAALVKEKGKNNYLLAPYSSYGKSVDIAAPTGFKSTSYKYDNSDAYVTKSSEGMYGITGYGGFNGTSAATPIVTGVASIILGMNPDFTPKEIKNIIIESAKKSGKVITKRYVDGGTPDAPTELTKHPIPILDAVGAVQYAKEIIEGRKVLVEATIPNFFKPNVKIELKTDFEIISSNWAITSGQGGANFAGDKTGIKIVPIWKDDTTIKVSVSGKLKHKDTGIIVDFKTEEESFNISHIMFVTKDTTTLETISGTRVSIETSPFVSLSNAVTNDKGKVKAYLFEGIYKVFVFHDSYKEYAEKDIHIGEQGQSIVTELALSNKNINPTGSIRGVVRNTEGNPIPNAKVRISGGVQTQGFFATAETNNEGVYWHTNISKVDVEGKPIDYFILSATAKGYAEKVIENIIIPDGKIMAKSFVLDVKDEEPSSSVIYKTSFENNEGGWDRTGLWHERNFSISSIFNTLVENGYSSLPPNENTDHAYLPKADDGDIAMWYGAADTGSFILTQRSEDSLKSGGTSMSAHSGTMTSPVIDLSSSTQPILRFKTWWEVEAVNPNENGYDLMDIKIAIDGGSFTTIKRLNPHIDPNDDDRKHKGFSSGGFNRKPVWVLEELDLSDYAGKTIHIQFAFNTEDALYNGFRGWLIDNLSIIEGTVSNDSSNKMSRSYRKSNFINSSKISIFDEFSEEYIRTHKKPKKYNPMVNHSR